VTGEAPAMREGGVAEEGWRRTFRRLGVDLRPGEGSPAALLFASLFLLLTFQIATKTIRQSTFIDALGAARLPLVYLLVALVSYPFLRLYNRFVDRYRIDQLFVASCVGVAASLVGVWILMRYSWTWVPVVFYVGSCSAHISSIRDRLAGCSVSSVRGRSWEASSGGSWRVWQGSWWEPARFCWWPQACW
jgi:hypothetical protein